MSKVRPDREAVRIIRNLLKQLDLTNVEEACDGATALAKLREEGDYDLVISDWTMEPMSGFDLLKEVRADDRLKNIPFVMSNYIVKPFNAVTLKAKLVGVLGDF